MTRLPGLLTLSLALLLPVEAAALSCLRPDVRRTFSELAARPEAYVVVTGTLAFDPARLPRTDHVTRPPEATRIPARLTGGSLTRDGFTRPYTADITLEVGCLAGWCGSLPADTEVLAFVEQTPEGQRLRIDACGGHAFPEPDRLMKEQVRACLSGAPCTATP